MATARSPTRSSTSARTGSPRRCSRAGAGPGSRIAHLDRTAPEVVELLIAASKIGAVAVPLNWRLATPELRGDRSTDAGAPVLIAGPAFAEIAAAVAAASRIAEVIDVGDDYEAWLAAADAADPGGRGEAADLGRCRCTRPARPACRRACSPRSATSPRRRSTSPPGASTRPPSASRRCRCSTSAASAGRSSGSGTARRRSSSASSTPWPCSTCSSARA